MDKFIKENMNISLKKIIIKTIRGIIECIPNHSGTGQNNLIALYSCEMLKNILPLDKDKTG